MAIHTSVYTPLHALHTKANWTLSTVESVRVKGCPVSSNLARPVASRTGSCSPCTTPRMLSGGCKAITLLPHALIQSREGDHIIQIGQSGQLGVGCKNDQEWISSCKQPTRCTRSTWDENETPQSQQDTMPTTQLRQMKPISRITVSSMDGKSSR